MRRFASLVVLLLFTIPFGISVTGCGHKAAPVQYCNGGDTGPAAGELYSITLSPTLAIEGESLNYGQIGQYLSATGEDCKGSTVSASKYIYATSNMQLADINPSTGQVCGGTWNRNSGGGIPDYTTCTPPTATASSNYLAYVTATAGGVTSNAIPVYVHPTATSIAFGAGAGCSTDPDTTCCPVTATTTSAPAYNGTSCISQNQTAQIAARIISTSAPLGYAITGNAVISAAGTTFTVAGGAVPPVARVVAISGVTGANVVGSNATIPPATINQSAVVTANQTTSTPYTFTVGTTFGQSPEAVSLSGTPVATTTSNITCNAGHLTYGTEGASDIVTIDQNGVATAGLPGSVSITAALSNSSSGSSVGYFSTCPPASITLAAVGQGSATSVPVNINNTQPFSTTVIDTMGNQITGLPLIYQSTTPQTIPTNGAAVDPIFPGTANITALCEPPTCNPAPYSQLGYLGNGKNVTSSGIQITAPGVSSTVLFVGSTNSQYIYPQDFTTGQPGALIKLPSLPNSMVITQDGSTIYMGGIDALTGKQTGLMTLTTANYAVGGPNVVIQGTVLSVSPDGNTVVVANPALGNTSLVVGGAIATSYGAVGTHAQWSPDSSTVYITTTTGTLLTHSTYTNWESVPLASSSTGAPASSDATYSDVAVMVPAIGAYFAGSPNTDGRSYCPVTTPTVSGAPPTEGNAFDPIADTKVVATDRIAATSDGNHILGASVAKGFSDIYFKTLTAQVGTNQPYGPASCSTIPQGQAASFTSSANTAAFTGVTPTQITGVDPDSNSALAFVTFNGTSNGKIPYYLPSPNSANGTLNYFTLANTSSTAPVAGVWSTDNFTFYLASQGDNLVHILTVAYPTGAAPTITDSSQVAPNLPSVSGSTIVAPNLIVQRPKRITQ